MARPPFRPWLDGTTEAAGWAAFEARVAAAVAAPDESLYLKAADGTRLALRAALPAGEPWAVALFLHGIALHSKLYLPFLDALAAAGIAAFGLDLRGHGASDGRPGDLGRRGTLLADVGLAQAALRRLFPDLPLIWVGHSLGAGLWWKQLARGEAAGAAFVSIASGPILAALGQAWRTGQLIMLPRPTRLLAEGLRPGARWIEVLTPPVPAEFGLVTRYSPRFLRDALPWGFGLRRLRAPMPVLAVIGEADQGFDPALLGQALRRVEGDVTLATYPEADHLNVFDPASPEILAWLQAKLRP